MYAHLSKSWGKRWLKAIENKRQSIQTKWPAAHFSSANMLINASNTTTETFNQFAKLKIEICCFEWSEPNRAENEERRGDRSRRGKTVQEKYLFYCYFELQWSGCREISERERERACVRRGEDKTIHAYSKCNKRWDVRFELCVRCWSSAFWFSSFTFCLVCCRVVFCCFCNRSGFHRSAKQ